MKKWGILFSASCLFFQVAIGQIKSDKPAMQWWQDAKFGLFLHWGLYSVAAGDWNGHPYKGNEHFMLYERIPWKVYGQTLAAKFDPQKFNADAWVKMAKNAGMKYIVITTKHHDGFAMFNSPSSDYNIVKMTPWAKDPMKLLAEACKKYGIKLCFYYSLGRDWQDPDVPTNWPVKAGRSNTWDYPNEDKKDIQKYFERKVKPQVKELLTQYGPIGVIWFDTPEMITRQESKELREMIHKLQPDCIVNSRIGNGYGYYSVSEQRIEGKIDLRPWESCVTMSGGWGYNKYDSAWKSPELIIRQFTETVSKGGNYLLNVGPMGNGAFPKPAIQRLVAIGKWMHINGEAIYGASSWHIASEKVGEDSSDDKTSLKTLDKNMGDVLNDATPKNIFPEIRFTQNGDNVYVFANSINTPELHVKALGTAHFKKIRNISVLDGRSVDWKQETDFVTIKMPKRKKDPINIYVFKVD